MTARTLPITPRGGLTLVHQPTRTTIQLPTATRLTVRSLTRRMAIWWRRANSRELHWEERDHLRRSGFPIYTDVHTWLPRPLNAGARHDW